MSIDGCTLLDETAEMDAHILIDWVYDVEVRKEGVAVSILVGGTSISNGDDGVAVRGTIQEVEEWTLNRS